VVDEELDENDLVQIINDTDTNNNEIDPAEDNEPTSLTAKIIREGLTLGWKLGNYFLQNDPNVERALRFQRDIN